MPMSLFHLQRFKVEDHYKKHHQWVHPEKQSQPKWQIPCPSRQKERQAPTPNQYKQAEEESPPSPPHNTGHHLYTCLAKPSRRITHSQYLQIQTKNGLTTPFHLIKTKKKREGEKKSIHHPSQQRTEASSPRLARWNSFPPPSMMHIPPNACAKVKPVPHSCGTQLKNVVTHG